uniref:Uncharacterized protein n=1 Tax=Pristionchus pacificus TaxID=54126 RepID=A0A2A6BMG0_PRIPA|eukprot:PDM67090.1 hypothetical protein PRIPAC_48507 [Pristionchus pacificus]
MHPSKCISSQKLDRNQMVVDANKRSSRKSVYMGTVSGQVSSSSFHLEPNGSALAQLYYDLYRTSGARYHSVTISWVYTRLGMEKPRARPKSASFTVPELSTRMF